MELKKLTVTKATLEKAVKRLAPFVKTTPLPILDNLKVVVEESKMTLYVTDLIISGKVSIDCSTKDNFAFLVDASRLLTILNTAGDTLKMTYETAKRILTIETNKSKHRLSCEEHEDFPEHTEVTGEEIVIPDLSKIFKKVVHCMDQKEPFPTFKGSVLINKDHVVATDGFRMIAVNHNAIIPLKEKEGIVIACKSANMIANMNEPVLVYQETDLKITDGEYEFITKLVDIGGSYPKYLSVFPEPTGIYVDVDVEELLSGIKSASISADAITKRVTVAYYEDKILIESDNPETGSNSKVEISCELKANKETPTPIVQSYNVSKLQDMVEIQDSKVMSLEISANPKRPMVLDIKEPFEYKYVLMPVHIER